jgi:hypothetical protein
MGNIFAHILDQRKMDIRRGEYVVVDLNSDFQRQSEETRAVCGPLFPRDVGRGCLEWTVQHGVWPSLVVLFMPGNFYVSPFYKSTDISERGERKIVDISL